MKLLSYDIGTGPRAGVLIDDDHIADASASLGSAITLRHVQAILEQPESPLDRLRAAVDGGISASTVRTKDVRLRAPVLRPPTVRDHIVFEEHATAEQPNCAQPLSARCRATGAASEGLRGVVGDLARGAP